MQHFQFHQNLIIYNNQITTTVINMAEIINYNAQDNPQLNELYEILLLAGYFRIRIGSLKAFDKVIGGMAWCITSSNFQIEVDYSDEMQIGQKIKVSEKICEALHQMKCPYVLQPFQLQGLDVNNIYPVIQWLVKLVYETRLENQKYNRNLSYLLGKRILGEYDQGNTDKIPKVSNPRVKVNKAMASTSYTNPLRVYSALLQFEDKSSLRMYNKLLHLSNQKANTKGQAANRKENKEGKQQLLTFLQQDQKQDEKLYQKDTNDFGSVGKMSLQRLQKIIQQSKDQIEQGIIEDKTDQLDAQQGEQQQVRQDRALRNFRLQAQKYETQLQVLNNQLQSLSGFQKQLQEDYNSVEQKYKIGSKQLSEISKQREELQQIKIEIQTELKQRNLKVNNQMEKLVQKKTKLKVKKSQVKKKAKTKLQQLARIKEMSLASIPQIDQEAFNKMMEEATVKKKIYDQKYQLLTTVNQELAIIQRKAENFTSPAQIAQYHQRFVELFEAINNLIERKRSMYSQSTNLQSIQKIVQNYQQILNNTKDNFRQTKKKAQRKQLAVDMKKILMGMEQNMTNSINTLEKIKSQRERHYGEYLDLIKQEREYLKYLRLLKVQYENAQKFYKQ